MDKRGKITLLAGFLLFVTILLFFILPVKSQSTTLENPKYTNGDLTVSFDKDGGLNKSILNFTLKSHPSVNYVKHVGAGNQVVMYYDVDSSYDLGDVLGNPKFIDIKTGQEVDRNWSYVYWGNEEYEHPIYGYVENSNGSESYVQTGTETLTRKAWLPYNSRNLPEGNIRIGIEVGVKDNDWIDGVWVVGGSEITKHAQWDTPVTDSHGISEEATGSHTAKLGATIFNNNASVENLTIVTKTASSTATIAIVRNTTGTELGRATFSGNDATFGNITLAPFTAYRIEAYKDGSSYTRSRFVIPPPVAGTNINWTAGSFNGAYDGSSAYNIINVTTSLPVNDSNYTITFNLTDSGTGEQISTGGSNPNINSISCDNGYSATNLENPHITTNTFNGVVDCTFSLDNYFTENKTITANSNKTVEVSMSPREGLTQEEHDWLEAVYNCVIGGTGCA